jgi:hypothetical protein
MAHLACHVTGRVCERLRAAAGLPHRGAIPSVLV